MLAASSCPPSKLFDKSLSRLISRYICKSSPATSCNNPLLPPQSVPAYVTRSLHWQSRRVAISMSGTGRGGSNYIKKKANWMIFERKTVWTEAYRKIWIFTEANLKMCLLRLKTETERRIEQISLSQLRRKKSFRHSDSNCTVQIPSRIRFAFILYEISKRLLGKVSISVIPFDNSLHQDAEYFLFGMLTVKLFADIMACQALQFVST